MTPSEQPPTYKDTLVRAASESLRTVPGIGPAVAVIVEDTHARQVARLDRTVSAIIDVTGEDRLAARLAGDEEVDVLFIEAVAAATRTGMRAKRQLLAKVVAAAVLDESQVEPAQLIEHALRDLEAPHIRALTRIRDAEDNAAQAAVRSGVKPEYSSVEAVVQAGRAESPAVVSVLLRTGTVHPNDTIGGRIDVSAMTDFGRELLTDLEAFD